MYNEPRPNKKCLLFMVQVMNKLAKSPSTLQSFRGQGVRGSVIFNTKEQERAWRITNGEFLQAKPGSGIYYLHILFAITWSLDCTSSQRMLGNTVPRSEVTSLWEFYTLKRRAQIFSGCVAIPASPTRELIHRPNCRYNVLFTDIAFQCSWLQS